jgi:hypothetical protein
MADTKISGLTGVSGGTLAGGDKVAVADASDLTQSYSATMDNVKTFVTTAPVFAAGSATAGSHPKFTSGTLLTTAEDGAFEFNGDAAYLTTDDGNRGVIPIEHLIRQDAAWTLANSASEQKLFNAVTDGTLTLEVGTYFFDSQFIITSMSATSGNAAFDLLGAGTATLGTVLYQVIGNDANSVVSSATRTGTFSTSAQTGAAMVTAGTGTALGAYLVGTFEVTGAGTIIPSVTILTAVATAAVAAGSYFKCNRVGSTSLTSIGQWS